MSEALYRGRSWDGRTTATTPPSRTEQKPNEQKPNLPRAGARANRVPKRPGPEPGTGATRNHRPTGAERNPTRAGSATPTGPQGTPTGVRQGSERPTAQEAPGPPQGAQDGQVTKPNPKSQSRTSLHHRGRRPDRSAEARRTEPGTATRNGTDGRSRRHDRATKQEAGPGRDGNRADRNRAIRRTEARHLLGKAARICSDMTTQARPRTAGKSTEHEPNWTKGQKHGPTGRPWRHHQVDKSASICSAMPHAKKTTEAPKVKSGAIRNRKGADAEPRRNGSLKNTAVRPQKATSETHGSTTEKRPKNGRRTSLRRQQGPTGVAQSFPQPDPKKAKKSQKKSRQKRPSVRYS